MCVCIYIYMYSGPISMGNMLQDVQRLYETTDNIEHYT
jgi:hypothetical protein